MTGGFRIATWHVEPQLHTVSRKGATVRLEPKVMEVLVCLARHAGEPVSKEELLQTVWPNTFVTDDGLKRSISELRQVFEDDVREPRIIQTIPKRGYRLLVSVEPINGTSVAAIAQPSRGLPKAGHNWRKLTWLSSGALALLLIAVGAVYVWKRQSGNPNPPIHSIAVLPLQNLSDDPNQDYFSDGMTDALITDLAQIGSLKVISRTSSLRYKQSGKSLPEIAHELGVDGIVEGTIQKSGDRVRITAQLIQAPSDKHLWANSYERNLRDVFAMERDVSADIAYQIRARLTTDKQVKLTQTRAVSPAALELYLQGKSYLHRFSRGFGDQELLLASEYFQRAIDAEPDFAAAYVGLSEARHGTLRSSDEDMDIATKAAERAVWLDPNLSDAWTELADIKCDSWDWAGAEQNYRRALALNPNDAVAHDGLWSLLDAQGRMDDGLKEAEIAQQLDPSEDHLEPALYSRHEYNKAIQHITTMLEADPDNGYLHHKLYEGYAGKGMYKEAIQQLEQTAALFGFQSTASELQQAFAASGYRGAMRRWAEQLERLAATNQVFLPINLASAYAAAGDKERAFYWLEQGYKRRGHTWSGVPMVFLNRYPGLEPLHADPRFKDLLRRVGLPE